MFNNIFVNIDIFSSAKKSYLSEENNNKNNTMSNIIQGKRINFNEDDPNLNLIQNKTNSNIYKSALKDDIKSSSFFSPVKSNIKNEAKISESNPNPQYPSQNKINLPPNVFEPSFLNQSNQNQINKINYVNNINGDNNKINQININQPNTNRNYLIKNLPKISCICTKTQCQKKYCMCFSYGIYCKDCECKGCLNVPNAKNKINYQENEINDEEEIVQNNNNIYQENKMIQSIGCNCTKSHCLKKYCECFKMKINCGSLCRCMECKNKNDNNNENINNLNIINNNLIEEDNDMKYFNNNINNIEILKEMSKNYDINAFEVFILNKNLIIEDRYVDLTDNKLNINTTPKLSNKKRSRTKNENSSIVRTCPTTNSSSRRTRRTTTQVNTNVKNKKLDIN